MNRTLLLILCDFLLLTLLALTDWEKAAPATPPPPKPAATATLGAGSATKEDDIVSVMKLSLEDERAQRDKLSQQLQTTQSNLSEQEKTLTQTREQADTLSKQYVAAAADAAATKENLDRTRRELEERQAEAARQAKELAALEKQQAEARAKIEDLNVAVRVAEVEKVQLRAATETLKEQVEAERTERIKVQETTTQLAQGVGQLATNSTALTKEIRDNRPINANIPIRPIPERGADGRYIASGDGQPEPEGLTTPTAYRSRATQRVRRPGYVRFNADGIVLHDRKRHEAFHLTEVADFDIAPDLDGISRLSLVLTDGTLRDLPGVMHGLWATNPLLIGNELQWWHAPEPVGEPDGALPWGSDDDPLILARLRAHLASAQATAGLPVTPAVP